MMQPNRSRDSAYYRTLIEKLTADHPWIHVQGQSDPSEAAQRASNDGHSIGEVRLSHLYTDADLYIALPDLRGGNSARAVLYHPLDQHIPSAEAGFIGSLSNSHQTIAEIYESEYIEAVADPTVILRGNIPFDYLDRKVHSMMTAITTVALRIQCLHEDIRAPLCSVLSEPQGPSNDPRSDDNHTASSREGTYCS